MPYFLLTLTVPDALRGVCKLKPAILYDLMLREAAGAVKDICRTKLGVNFPPFIIENRRFRSN